MGRFSGDGVRALDPAESARYLADGRWRDRTMVDDFLDQAATQPHKAAIVTYALGHVMPTNPVPTTVTFGQLSAMSERIALKLLDLGIERDDVVSIQLPNGWQFAAITLAALRVGAVVNPLVSIFRHNELSFMLGRAESKIFFVPSEFRGFDHAGLASDLQNELDCLETTVVVGGEHEQMLSFDRDFLSPRSETVAEVADRLNGLARRPDEVITVMYTSGTTGEPKGTLHTCNTMWSNGRPLFRELAIDGDDVCFMASTMGT